MRYKAPILANLDRSLVIDMGIWNFQKRKQIWPLILWFSIGASYAVGANPRIHLPGMLVEVSTCADTLGDGSDYPRYVNSALRDGVVDPAQVGEYIARRMWRKYYYTRFKAAQGDVDQAMKLKWNTFQQQITGEAMARLQSLLTRESGPVNIANESVLNIFVSFVIQRGFLSMVGYTVSEHYVKKEKPVLHLFDIEGEKRKTQFMNGVNFIKGSLSGDLANTFPARLYLIQQSHFNVRTAALEMADSPRVPRVVKEEIRLELDFMEGMAVEVKAHPFFQCYIYYAYELYMGGMGSQAATVVSLRSSDSGDTTLRGGEN